MAQVSLRSLNHANHMKSMGLEPRAGVEDGMAKLPPRGGCEG